LFCYGQNVSRTTYADLFALIGTTYGSGDGITTFGLPDLRGTITPGKDDMGGVAASRLTTTFYGTDPTVLGNRGGAQSKVLLSANLPAYTPAGAITNGAITIGGQTSLRNVAGGGDNNNNGGGGGSFSAMSSTAPTLTGSQASSTFAGTAQGGTSTPFSEIQPSLIMNKIIYAGV
jgi:microcystin-dependent protein